MKNKVYSGFIKNTSWIMIGKATQLALTFITTMFISRYLGPTKNGLITYTYSYVSLFLPLCTLGMNDIVVKEVLDKENDKNTVIGSIVVLRMISSLLSIGFIYIVLKNVTNTSDFIYIGMLQSLSLFFQSFDTIVYLYQAQMCSEKTGKIYVVTYLLTTIFRIFCILTKKDVAYFAFAVSLDYIVMSIFLLILFYKENGMFKFSLKTSIKLLKRSYPYIFSGIMIIIYSKADTIILGKTIDETSVGLYSAATTLCNAWPFILTAIIDSASPVIVKEYSVDIKSFEKKIRRLYATVFYISVAVAIFISIFAKPIIQILYGINYLSAVKPLRIVCWSTIFAYLGVARSPWMQCEHKSKYEAVLSFLGAIVNVILNLILIKKFNLVGAGLALLLTQFLTNIVFVYLIKDTRHNVKLILDAIMLKDVIK